MNGTFKLTTQINLETTYWKNFNHFINFYNFTHFLGNKNVKKLLIHIFENNYTIINEKLKGSYNSLYSLKPTISSETTYSLIMPHIYTTGFLKFDNIIQTIELYSIVSFENIAPKLHPTKPFILLCSNKSDELLEYKLIIISEKYQSDLWYYFKHTQSISHDIYAEIVTKIYDLFKKMIDLNIFYIDAKPNNTVINDYGENREIRIIDWDIQYTCSGQDTPKSNVPTICNILHDNNSIYKDPFLYIVLIIYAINLHVFIPTTFKDKFKQLENYSNFKKNMIDGIRKILNSDQGILELARVFKDY